MPARIRKRYDGTESDVLINGQFYTYNELAEASGITYKAITNRLGRRPFVTDRDLLPVRPIYNHYNHLKHWPLTM